MIANTETIQGVAYARDDQTFVFLFTTENDVLAMMAIAGFAINPQIPFNWFDAGRVRQMILETMEGMENRTQ